MRISAIIALYLVLGLGGQPASACDNCGGPTCWPVWAALGLRPEGPARWCAASARRPGYRGPSSARKSARLMPGCHDCCHHGCPPPPRCGHPKCVQKLIKTEYQVNVPIYKGVVRYLCLSCANGQSPQTADIRRPMRARPPNLPGPPPAIPMPPSARSNSIAYPPYSLVALTRLWSLGKLIFTLRRGITSFSGRRPPFSPSKAEIGRLPASDRENKGGCDHAFTHDCFRFGDSSCGHRTRRIASRRPGASINSSREPGAGRTFSRWPGESRGPAAMAICLSQR